MTGERPAAFFVYGLLRPGQRLHHLVEPFVTSLADGTVRGRLYDAGVPAARFDRDGIVEGVVLDVDPARLLDAEGVLDEVEDEGEAYRRIVVDVSCADGARRAQAYEWLGRIEGLPDVGPSWPGARRA